MIKDIIILTLTALVFMQAGYLLKTYINYTTGAAPLVTPSDLVLLMEEKR